MLNIKRVYGENFCQYPTFDYILGPGLTCLMGLNGSGKSNFVRSLVLCLQGEVYGPGNLVRDGRKKGYVAMDIDCPRGSFTIRRDLKHNEKTGGTIIKHSLDASWLDSPLERKLDVAAFMSNWIGGTSKTLEYVSIARQGKFSELIEADHMDRAKMLNTLMGHDRAEKLRDVLQKAARKIADMPDRSQLISMTNADIEDLVKRIENAEVNMPEISPEMESLYKNALKAQGRVLDDQRQAQLGLCQTTLLEAEEKLKAARIVRSALRNPEDIEAPDENAYACYKEYERAKEYHENAQENLRTLPPPPEDPEIPESWFTERAQATSSLSVEIGQLDREIAAAGNGICPTCNRPFDNPVDVEELKKQREEKRAEVGNLMVEVNEARRTVDGYERKKLEHTTTMNNIKSSVALHRKNMEDYKEYADFNVADHEAKRAAYNDLVKLQNAIAAADKEIDKWKHTIEVQNLEKSRLEGLEVVTQEEKQQATETIEAYETLQKAKEDAQAAAAALNAQLKAKQARLAELEKDQADGQTNREALELLEFARDQLHAEALPRLAAQSSIHAINAAMQRYLDMFSFPYPFYLDEHLDFRFDRPHAKGVDAEGLSGGEMVRAAIAMRFALMEVFKAGCGMLIVDEPTTGQDEDARTALVEVLAIAASHFRHQSIKIICPTHARELAAAADNILTIGEHQI